MTLIEFAKSGPASLVAQGFDGVEPRRLGRRVDAEEDADRRPRSRRRAPTAQSGDVGGREAGDQLATEDSQPVAEGEADAAADQRQGDRLDQELEQDVLPLARPTALRTPISRVRSVTETSMMFMMPMPPTSRAMPTTPPTTAVTLPRTC